MPVPIPTESNALAREAEVAIQALNAFLAHPAFQQQVALSVLTKVALDTSAAPRERRRAAEVLANLQVRAAELLASLTGAREKRLRDLGIEAPATEVNLTQVTNQIEIVREGKKDWRVLDAG